MATVEHRKHRWLVLVIAATVSALTGFVYNSQLLSLLTPDHWCRDMDVETLQAQLPLLPEEGKKFSLPPVSLPGGGDRVGYSQCEKYGGDLVGAYVVWISARRPEYRRTGVVTFCNQGWTYNLTALFSTIPSQMDWVCGSRWKPYVIHGAFWFAASAGVVLWSGASLRLGRPLTLLFALTLYLLGGLATLLATGFFSVLVSRIVGGLSHLAIRHQSLLIALEGSHAKDRSLVFAAILVAYTGASLIITFTAMLVTSWWWLTLIAVLPTIVCMMMAARLFLKESPKKVHIPVNNDILAFHITDNIKVLEVPILEPVQVPEKPHDRPAVVHIVWIATSLCYFGMSQNSPTLVSSALGTRPTDVAVFSSCWYAALMEAPCWGLPLLLPTACRRRWAIGVSLATAAILTVSPVLIAAGTSSMGVMSLLLLARLVTTAAYYTMLQHRMEVPVRDQQGQMAGEALGGASIALVPAIAALAEFSPRVSTLILGSVAVFGALASLWLAEGNTKSMTTYRRLSNWLQQVQVSRRFSVNKDNSGCILEDSSLPYKPLDCQ